MIREMAPTKRYNELSKKVDKEKIYSPHEAIALAKATAGAKFDESIEIHIRLGVDSKQSDQQIRGSVVLPNGTGKDVKVVVFAQGEKAKEAEEAGADFVGGDDIAEKIKKGWTDFDAAVSTPDMMAIVGKIGRILGPRGLMPNPKIGTVTVDVAKAVKDIKAGKVEYRLDKYSIVHTIIGKASFNEKALTENYGVLIEEIVRARPSSAKGRYIISISLSSSMGPGIKVDTSKTNILAEEEKVAG